MKLPRFECNNGSVGFFYYQLQHLLGKGIYPEHLNDDKIGRVMDKCYSYGISELFLLIALAAVKKYQVNLGYSHLDSSSFSVHGEYKELLPLRQESDTVGESHLCRNQ